MRADCSVSGKAPPPPPQGRALAAATVQHPVAATTQQPPPASSRTITFTIRTCAGQTVRKHPEEHASKFGPSHSQHSNFVIFEVTSGSAASWFSSVASSPGSRSIHLQSHRSAVGVWQVRAEQDGNRSGDGARIGVSARVRRAGKQAPRPPAHTRDAQVAPCEGHALQGRPSPRAQRLQQRAAQPVLHLQLAHVRCQRRQQGRKGEPCRRGGRYVDGRAQAGRLAGPGCQATSERSPKQGRVAHA